MLITTQLKIVLKIMNNQIKILLTIWIAGLLTTGSQKAFTQSLPGYFGVNLAGAE